MAHTLDDWMRNNGVTDAALAETVGVSRSFITRIRAGKRQPSLPVAVKLAGKTRLPLTAFLTSSVGRAA